MNDVDIIPALTALCRLLSSAPVTMGDVQQELAELGVEATVQAKPGTDAPAFVHVTLPEASGVTLDALCDEFGPYRALPRTQRNAPIEYLFRVDWPDYPYTCALVAEKRPDRSAVEAVAVRRDVRLD